MIPTPFLRWVRRDTEGPSRVLQCWHVEDFEGLKPLMQGADTPDDHLHYGEWIDVPTFEPVVVVAPAQEGMTEPLSPFQQFVQIRLAQMWESLNLSEYHRGYPANPLVKR